MADVAVHTTITDRVAVLTLSHPARRNALNIALSALLAEAVQAAADDPEVGAIVVTGEDPAFCAGGDLAELATAGPAQLKTVYAGFLALADCPLPTIAAVNGAAVGAGLNLALATDLRLAGPRASFDSRFLQLGLHPGGGYTWMAQRVLGPQGAAAMTLFGEAVDAGGGGTHRAGAPGRRRRRRRGRGDGGAGPRRRAATWPSRRRARCASPRAWRRRPRPSRSRCGPRPSRCDRTSSSRGWRRCRPGSAEAGKPDVSESGTPACAVGRGETTLGARAS